MPIQDLNFRTALQHDTTEDPASGDPNDRNPMNSLGRAYPLSVAIPEAFGHHARGKRHQNRHGMKLAYLTTTRLAATVEMLFQALSESYLK